MSVATHVAQPIAISVPECAHGIGDVITAVDSPKLIAGVKCVPVALWPDDRGYFLEVQRAGQGLNGHFPLETTQISAAQWLLQIDRELQHK